MAVLDRRQFLEREALVDEQADLLQVVLAQVLAQRLAHRVGAGLGDRGEDEAVLVGNDHGGMIGQVARVSAAHPGTQAMRPGAPDQARGYPGYQSGHMPTRSRRESATKSICSNLR